MSEFKETLSGDTASSNPGGGGEGQPPANPAQSGVQRGVLCIKCEHLNPQGIDECEHCRTHLFVNCKECGTKNARVNPRCMKCGRRMHKRRKRPPPPRSGMNRLVAGLVMAGILVAMLLLLLLWGGTDFLR